MEQIAKKYNIPMDLYKYVMMDCILPSKEFYKVNLKKILDELKFYVLLVSMSYRYGVFCWPYPATSSSLFLKRILSDRRYLRTNKF